MQMQWRSEASRMLDDRPGGLRSDPQKGSRYSFLLDMT
jgi:hypothetical protein